MNSKLEAAQNKFIGSIGRLCDNFGLNRFVAQLYTVLYFSDKPLSLDEITERLKVSKGNVSLNIRELEKWGAVRSVWVKGSRKDYYEANIDIKNLIMSKIKSGVQKRISEVDDVLKDFKAISESSQEGMTDEDKRAIKLYEERLKSIEDIKSLALSAISIADKLI